ncbi:Hypothetical predicted protein [Octopus vulgaris]|uniref:Uncharacterized protein n=1 Tax=Octopus vulgaris TaxID=6645 RepID=A0AA36EVY8_OCTVU|nr:Hypothetical predicted protein [Octopus vulgaris]
MFKNNPKNFYRKIGKTPVTVKSKEVQGFWNKIWAEEKSHNEKATWIDRIATVLYSLEEQKWEGVKVEDVRSALRRSSKWKSPGKDKIPNFWLNDFPESHELLTELYNDVLQHPSRMPAWLVDGLTFLLPKSEETNEPKKL